MKLPKTGFIVLLVLGILSFGFVAMIVYVLAGPDEMAVQPSMRTRPTLPAA